MQEFQFIFSLKKANAVHKQSAINQPFEEELWLSQNYVDEMQGQLAANAIA
jgi:hypothetical protein